MDEFKQLLMKKAKEQKGKPNDSKLSAKMSVLKELKDVMSGEMGKDLSGMKKVSVMSDSEEGLKKGLEKAEDIVEQKIPMEGESSEEMSEEEPSHEMSDMSLPDNLDEINSLIQMLESKKQELMSK